MYSFLFTLYNEFYFINTFISQSIQVKKKLEFNACLKQTKQGMVVFLLMLTLVMKQTPVLNQMLVIKLSSMGQHSKVKHSILGVVCGAITIKYFT
jgi:hypothetical protein